jgi:hypothetical protein
MKYKALYRLAMGELLKTTRKWHSISEEEIAAKIAEIEARERQA